MEQSIIKNLVKRKPIYLKSGYCYYSGYIKDDLCYLTQELFYDFTLGQYIQEQVNRVYIAKYIKSQIITKFQYENVLLKSL